MILTTDERAEIAIDAIAHYGKDSQLDKAIEEMSELTKAICDLKRNETVQNTVNVIEEIADVFIMMIQMMIIFGVNEVDNLIEVKLARLKERMEDERARDTVEDTVSDIFNEDAPGDQARA
jgi:phosphoribosyl-ATP pyrophosphohydrolase